MKKKYFMQPLADIFFAAFFGSLNNQKKNIYNIIKSLTSRYFYYQGNLETGAHVRKKSYLHPHFVRLTKIFVCKLL